jgi:hypothetical protein
VPALTCSALKHDTLCNARLLVAITPIESENRRNFNSLSPFLSASPANEENILNNRKKEHLQNEQNILHNRKKEQRSLRSQTATKQHEAKKARGRRTKHTETRERRHWQTQTQLIETNEQPRRKGDSGSNLGPHEYMLTALLQSSNQPWVKQNLQRGRKINLNLF